MLPKDPIMLMSFLNTKLRRRQDSTMIPNETSSAEFGHQRCRTAV